MDADDVDERKKKIFGENEGNPPRTNRSVTMTAKDQRKRDQRVDGDEPKGDEVGKNSVEDAEKRDLLE
jgi:hypothetical protein